MSKSIVFGIVAVLAAVIGAAAGVFVTKKGYDKSMVKGLKEAAEKAVALKDEIFAQCEKTEVKI